MKYLDLRTVFLFKKKLVGDSLSARCSFKSFVFLVVMMLMTTSNLFAQFAGFIDGYFARFAQDPETKTATLRYVSLEDAHNVDFVIPETITEDGITYLVVGLGDRCFEHCYALNSVTIPSSVTSLGDNCFAECQELSRFDFRYYSSVFNVVGRGLLFRLSQFDFSDDSFISHVFGGQLLLRL